MPTIHVSSLVTKEIPLDPNNLAESLEACATELTKLVADYKNMAMVIKDKNIKAMSADGDSHCGGFVVDDIDYARLKQGGLLADHTDPNNTEWRAFFYDPKLDKAISDAMTQLENSPDCSGCHCGSCESDSEDHCECPDCADEQDHCGCEDCNEDSCGGDCENCENCGDSESSEQDFSKEYSFEDAFNDLVFDPENKTFTFKCDGCNEIHTEKLETMYKGLRKVVKILFDASSGEEDLDLSDPDKASEILADILDHDWELGFILGLLEQEYGMNLEDSDEEVENMEEDSEDAEEESE